MLTRKEAQDITLKILRDNIYTDNEYVWVSSPEGMFLSTPTEEKLQGESWNNFRDSNGNPVFDIMESAAKRSGSKPEPYIWSSSRIDDNGEKIETDVHSVVIKSSLWSWYIGNGISSEDINDTIWSNVKLFLSISLSIIFTVALAKAS